MVIKIEQRTHYSGHILGPRSPNTYHSGSVLRGTQTRKCFTVNFDVLLTMHLSIFILVINQLDAQNLFCNKFISYLYMFRAPCAHRQEVKIVLYSLWYHHTETSEWSKITKITTCYLNILVILVILVILDHSLVSV